MIHVTPEEALAYHCLAGRPGKIAVVPTKPLRTQRDLSLAYTPGVAAPVLEIERRPEAAYELTSKGNLVAVVSNGTAVLGLGNRGPLASKPVMEGKGVLFKRFADIDVFDLELDAPTADDVVGAVKALAPTFGGINLEDIKAPECFEIEQRLQEMLDIPVFHDDQHGTAVIATAALINALHLTGRRAEEARVVVSGAGAAAMSCAALAIQVGVRRENVILVDSKGVIHRGRAAGMNAYKQRWASDSAARTLAEALRGADVFYGLSVADVLSPAMVRAMSDRPIIFAMANPDPEIRYDAAKSTAPGSIVATGRSDYPNQVNNVLGFPFIFRGALDVRARRIDDGMKLAAARALAALAREEAPPCVLEAYGLSDLRFGDDYIIPKPFDPRVLFWVAPAVAEAAMSSGVARRAVNLLAYRAALMERLPRDVTQFPECGECHVCHDGLGGSAADAPACVGAT